jgi:beta-1,4-mannosyl-glycoprotein beta-1,4-N-acetylglucosaminyltransferase
MSDLAKYPREQIKVLDAFLFYNELDLLKVRLAYLGEHVDQFIITEANIDFAGKPKPFVLNSELILSLPFSEKIVYHQEFIDLESIAWRYRRIRYRNRKSKFLWMIQDAQRNSLLKPLRKYSKNDIVIFSDLDEFPAIPALHEAIKILNLDSSKQNRLALSLQQLFFYFNVNSCAHADLFYGSVIAKNAAFFKVEPHQLRADKNDLLHIQNGGWHFSYFMDEEKIINKVLAISDVEGLSHFKQLSVDEVRYKVANKLDLYDRPVPLVGKPANPIPEKLLGLIQKHLPICA